MNEFYTKGLAGESISDEERDEALKRMKEASVVSPELVSTVVDRMREDNIEFLCAPFEAEWQCVALVLDKLADNILMGMKLTWNVPEGLLMEAMCWYESRCAVDFVVTSWTTVLPFYSSVTLCHT